MASLIYDNALLNEAKGLIDFDSDTFKVMLVTSSYTPDKANHAYRSSVTNEVVGTGYTAGGASAGSCTVAVDTVNHREEITLAAVPRGQPRRSRRAARSTTSRGAACRRPTRSSPTSTSAATSRPLAAPSRLTASTLRIQN
jgi:hypothetical protein